LELAFPATGDVVVHRTLTGHAEQVLHRQDSAQRTGPLQCLEQGVPDPRGAFQITHPRLARPLRADGAQLRDQVVQDLLAFSPFVQQFARIVGGEYGASAPGRFAGRADLGDAQQTPMDQPLGDVIGVGATDRGPLGGLGNRRPAQVQHLQVEPGFLGIEPGVDQLLPHELSSCRESTTFAWNILARPIP
jgi:hypothetical protein